MPPVITATNRQLEDTLSKVYETLRRTENRTLEAKERVKNTLERSSIHLHKSETAKADLTESLNLTTQSSVNTIKNGVYCTTSFDSNKLSAPTCVTRRPLLETGNVSASTQDCRETTQPKNTKIRNMVFKTLDRLFQFQNKQSKRPIHSFQGPSSPTQSDTLHSSEKQGNDTLALSLDTLKRLAQNEADTLPREKSNLEKDKLSLANENVLECSYGTSSSSDESFGEFIEGPLRYVEVPIDSTLETIPTQNQEYSPNILPSVSSQETVDPAPKVRYEKKEAKCKGNGKVKRRVRERQAQTTTAEADSSSLDFSAQSPEHLASKNGKNPPKMNRPDSPRPVASFSPISKSLPILVRDAIEELDSSDCGVDTFSREIAHRASSTMSKSLPSFAVNHEDDDDALSSSSSFSSLQRVQDFVAATRRRSAHESTLPMPSALCKDVLVSPIIVPVFPINQAKELKQSVGIGENTFKRRAEVYKPELSDNHESKTVPSTSTVTRLEGSSTSQAVDSVLEKTETNLNAQVPGKIISQSTSMPPPPPPPFPQPGNQSYRTLGGFLQVSVFTQKQKGNVFNIMKPIPIDEADAAKVKEKFFGKLTGKHFKGARKKKEKENTLSKEDIKFMRNIEMFLKTYKIKDHKQLTSCIISLNTRKDGVDQEWLSTLSQRIPKEEQINEMKKGNLDRFGNKAAGLFVSDLLRIKNLHGLTESIQFSLDFPEATSKLEKWAESFIGLCNKIINSEKFINFINVIMQFMQSLNTSEQLEIYGFDIQELPKLETRKSEDGTTFLQYVIEYILDKPHLQSTVDFYEAFTNLNEVTKTSISEMRAKYREWKQFLVQYKLHIQESAANNPTIADDILRKNTFEIEAELKLKQLRLLLDEAQRTFGDLKQHFGLLNSSTDEVMFFDAMSRFVNAYQNTYDNVVKRRKKEEQKLNLTQQRKLNFGLRNGKENGICSGEEKRRPAQPRRSSMFNIPVQNEHDDLENPSVKSKPKRRSLSPKAASNSPDDPLSERLNEILMGLRPCARRSKY